MLPAIFLYVWNVFIQKVLSLLCTTRKSGPYFCKYLTTAFPWFLEGCFFFFFFFLTNPPSTNQQNLLDPAFQVHYLVASLLSSCRFCLTFFFFFIPSKLKTKHLNFLHENISEIWSKHPQVYTFSENKIFENCHPAQWCRDSPDPDLKQFLYFLKLS